jgi:hypothetical protein
MREYYMPHGNDVGVKAGFAVHAAPWTKAKPVM